MFYGNINKEIMKNKDKKTPKTNSNEYILSSDAESILYGLILVLLSLIGLLSNGIVGEALTFIFAYIFGIFYVFVYLFLIFLGLYLIIKKTMFKLKIDLKILGFMLLLISFCIAASMESNLTITNFFNIYQGQMDNVSSSIFTIDKTMEIFNNLGGGLLGYFLCGALNSTISNSGTAIVVFVFLILGLILLFKNLFIRIVKAIVNYHRNRKKIREEEERKKEILEDIEKRHENIEPDVVKNEQKNKTNEQIEQIEAPHRVEASSILSNLNDDEDRLKDVDDRIILDEFSNIRRVGEDDEIKEEKVVVESPLEEIKIIKPAVQERVEENKPIEEIVSIKPEENIESEQEIIQSEELDEDIEPIIPNIKINSNQTIVRVVETEEKKIEEEKTIEPNNNYENYRFPPIALLKDRINADETQRKVNLAEDRLNKINECFHDLGIGANVISYTIGPSVTRFDVKVNPNVKTNVLCSIENDLAVRLGGNKTVRLETIVEGKNTSGIEVGNDICDVVSFKECLSAIASNTKDKLLFPLGKDISGNVVSCKLDDMPHLLVCGTTGSGKSVFIHNIIVSLIMRNKPNELKLMLIDPKRIEFTKYHELPHLLCPVITSTEQGKVGLMRLVDEMERRYDLFAEKGRGASNYKEYLETCEEMGYEKIPYIVMICDEFADFLSDGDKEVPKLIQRIAQKARACGIHMVIATQRPSAKVITGEIKANVPSRIALSVSSPLESRIIIDEQGAENLMGRGDLLARIPSRKSLMRVQSAYIDSKEIFQVCEFIKNQAKFVCDPYFQDLTIKVSSPLNGVTGGESQSISMARDYHNDEKYEEIKRFVIATGKCSTTKLENTFGIGYSRADGILDTLEMDGIIKKEGNRRVLTEKYLNNSDEDDDNE